VLFVCCVLLAGSVDLSRNEFLLRAKITTAHVQTLLALQQETKNLNTLIAIVPRSAMRMREKDEQEATSWN
jgi:hypothetical protein